MQGLFCRAAAALCVLGAAMIVAKAQAGRDHPLLVAATRGNLAEVERLIAAKADLNARDDLGQTALLIAVQQNHEPIASRLIEAGADINAQAKNLDTPWLLAGARGRTAMLEWMLATGRVDYAKRNRFGGNALIPAAHMGHVDAVRLLLTKSKIDVDHINNQGWTALLEAVILSDGGPTHVEIVRLLVRHGAGVNIADKDGVTPLAHARRRGYAAIARILEEAGAR